VEQLGLWYGNGCGHGEDMSTSLNENLPEVLRSVRTRPLFVMRLDVRQLFRKALDRYQASHAAFWKEALDAPTAFEAVKRLLHGTAERLTDKRNPPGCLIVQGALCGGEECDSVKAELASRRNASVALIRERLKRARAAGDLPANADPAGLARYVVTVIHGMAVQAASGTTRAELRRVAETAE
jgi:hypothetical protein